jgi:amino acid transporter
LNDSEAVLDNSDSRALTGKNPQSILHYATSRPRVLGWIRSAAILDGDWGTSIAYVLGISFALAGYTSFWHLMMMLGLTSIIALNYVTICRLHPNGGGVYSSVYHRSKNFAVVGALLLGADYIITTSLSVLDACHYLGFEHPHIWAIGIIAAIGVINWFGPRHSGGLAVIISAATILTILTIIAFSLPGTLAKEYVQPMEGGFINNWSVFVGIILSISGIEAISNMTGLMKDPERDSRRAILSVLTKVAIATLFLGLAMNAIPGIVAKEHTEDMIRFIGEHYVGSWFGWVVAVSMGFLLISAGNTAVNGLLNIQFLMAVDGELPILLRKLNSKGVPVAPLLIATVAPIVVLLLINNVLILSSLYAIGVVGAVCINVLSTGTDVKMKMKMLTRVMMIASGILLFCIEMTIVVEKPLATAFAAIVLTSGLGARYISKRRKEQQPVVLETPVFSARHRQRSRKLPEVKYLLALKDRSDRLLKFAIDEAKQRRAMLIILRVREVKLDSLPAMLPMKSNGVELYIEEKCAEANIDYQLISIPSYEVGYTVAEQAAMFGVERVIVGAQSRGLLQTVLRGSVIRSISQILPDEIRLIIFGG